MKIELENNDWSSTAIFVAALVITVVLAYITTKINKRVFNKLKEKHKGLHLAFFERVNNIVIFVVIIVVAISAFDGTRSVWQTLLGGTAIISAVLAFAAQDVIKDILAGLMISMNKPFDIGDRVAFDNGTIGIISDITVRHVVVIGFDTVRYIIPNSKVNAMEITNYSFGRKDRSIRFDFNVSYDSDIEKVKSVMQQTVKSSPLSKPQYVAPDGKEIYSPAYFIKYADSSLVMMITVYYDNSIATEKVINDINSRMFEAFKLYDIEIPYNYINVIQK